MTQDKPSNVAASVRQRLLKIIRETGDDANLVWTRYATERLLYRLSVSEYAGDFILKGAMLFMAWTGQLYRPTVDMDFLSYGVASGERLMGVFRNVCAIEVKPDGLEFDANSVKAAPIREEQEYQGQRVTLTAFLGKGGFRKDVPKLPDVLWHLREFLLPLLKAASGQAHAPKIWNAGGPWVSAKSETGDI